MVVNSQEPVRHVNMCPEEREELRSRGNSRDTITSCRFRHQSRVGLSLIYNVAYGKWTGMKRTTQVREAGSSQRTGEPNVKVIYPKKESRLHQKAIVS